jgi:diguanylate cyclase (GGDEF)-like protein/PAS domain S-box-containing protein
MSPSAFTPAAFDLGLSKPDASSVLKYRSLRRWALLILILFEIAGVYGLYRNWRNEVENGQAKQQLTLDIAYQAAVNMYQLAAESLFQDIPRHVGLFETFQMGVEAAATGDAVKANQLRGKLYRELYPIYQQMRNSGFRQFQFHSPSGQSFLRWHAPEAHGYALFDTRPDLKKVNFEQKPRSGFEIGMDQAAIRYIFPVLHQGKHLGSVEYGVPFSVVRDAISALDRSREYAFLLRSDRVKQVVRANIVERYGASALSDDYLVEDLKAMLPDSLQPLSPEALALSARLRDMPQIQHALKVGKHAAVSLEQNGASWIVLLHPVLNMEGKQAAFMVTFARDTAVAVLNKQFILYACLYTVLLAGLGFAFWRFYRTSDALLAERKTLKLLTDTMSDGLLATDGAGSVVAINPAMREMSGFLHAADLNAWASRLFYAPALTADEPPPEAGQQRASGGSHVLEASLIRRDGRQISVEFTSKAILEHDQYCGMVAVIRDVTARKQAEEELLLAAHVFRNTGEGVIITDQNEHILVVNEAFSKISGYALDAVKGHKPNILSAGLNNEQAFFEMRAALEKSSHYHGEFLNSKPDGTLYVADMTISVVRDQAGNLTHYVGVFRDISEQKQSTEMMKRFALHDILTGLPNRAFLHERLDKVLRNYATSKQGSALLFLDLDRFKHINDSLGHGVGDQILQQVTGRLLGSVRDGDTVARIGGDEFFILLESIVSHRQVEEVVQRILSDMTKPYLIDPLNLHLTCSIGISFFPDDGMDAESLVRKADMAMYEAKRNGCNSFHVFESDLLGRASERLEIGNALHGATARGELRVFYQPQNRASDGACEGVEALVRWIHPTRGMISPALFIPIAEDIGLIGEIGTWVLRESCRQLAAWHQMGIDIPRVAVNLSVQQLENEDLPTIVADALREYDLDTSELELEVTESMIMNQADKIIKILNALSDMGIKLAIDDFGTGYSSLAYLKNLPVKRLKIDQSFVREITTDPNDKAIARAIIALGHSMEMDVLAEGVETEAQAEFLRAENCDVLQGYLFSKPLPADEIAPLWRSDTSKQHSRAMHPAVSNIPYSRDEG